MPPKKGSSKRTAAGSSRQPPASGAAAYSKVPSRKRSPSPDDDRKPAARKKTTKSGGGRSSTERTRAARELEETERGVILDGIRVLFVIRDKESGLCPQLDATSDDVPDPPSVAGIPTKEAYNPGYGSQLHEFMSAPGNLVYRFDALSYFGYHNRKGPLATESTDHVVPPDSWPSDPDFSAKHQRDHKLEIKGEDMNRLLRIVTVRKVKLPDGTSRTEYSTPTSLFLVGILMMIRYQEERKLAKVPFFRFTAMSTIRRCIYHNRAATIAHISANYDLVVHGNEHQFLRYDDVDEGVYGDFWMFMCELASRWNTKVSNALSSSLFFLQLST